MKDSVGNKRLVFSSASREAREFVCGF